MFGNIHATIALTLNFPLLFGHECFNSLMPGSNKKVAHSYSYQ